MSRWERWGGIAGVTFAVTFAVGFVLFALAQPDFDQPQAELVADWKATRNQALVYFGDHLMRVSVLFLLWFIAVLWQRLRGRDHGDPLAAVVLASGVAFALVLLLGVAFPDAVDHEGAEGHVHGELGRISADLGLYTFLTLSAIPLAACLAATAIVGSRTQSLPRWATRSAAVLAALLLVTSIPIELVHPIFALFLLWTIGVGIVLWREPQPQTRT